MCDDPVTPTNGQRSLSSTTYNSVVTYTCDVGYTLQGVNSRTCQSDGQWSGSVPQCFKKSMFLQTFAVTNCVAWSALKLAGQTFGFFAGYKYIFINVMRLVQESNSQSLGCGPMWGISIKW